MKNLLLAAAIAALPFGVASAFASSPGYDAEWDIGNNPTSLPCHFVREAVTMQNGHVVYRNVQVCN